MLETTQASGQGAVQRDDLHQLASGVASRPRPRILLAIRAVLILVLLAVLALADEALTQGEIRRALGGLLDNTSSS